MDYDLKWLSNTRDPYIVALRKGETLEQTALKYQEWLKDKVIGDPMPINGQSLDWLKSQKLVGVYARVENHEENIIST